MLNIISKNVTTFIVLSILVLPVLAESQIRSSSNYQIERDSLNTGGGLSGSTNYSLEDTTGDVATGESSSTNYGVLAGYQQPDDTFITITAPADVNMDSISGLIGGTSTSSVSWTVSTNNNSGYTLSIKADTSPALASAGDSFADYTPGGDPDYDWSIAATTAEFGYSVESDDVVTKFKDNGSNTCNTGSNNTNQKCWDGFTTSDASIATKASANAPAGTLTRVELQAESGTNKILQAGSYNATLTATAVTL